MAGENLERSQTLLARSSGKEYAVTRSIVEDRHHKYRTILKGNATLDEFERAHGSVRTDKGFGQVRRNR